MCNLTQAASLQNSSSIKVYAFTTPIKGFLALANIDIILHGLSFWTKISSTPNKKIEKSAIYMTNPSLIVEFFNTMVTPERM